VFQHHGSNADSNLRHRKFDKRNSRFAPGRTFGDGGDIRNLGADPAVRRRWDRRNRVGYVRERHDRIVQSNLFGFVSNPRLADHRRARRNSDGIHRARNGRRQSVAGYYAAEPVDRRADRDEYRAMSDYGNVDDGRIIDVFRRLLTTRS
jgi:hypothetical protein